MSRVESPKSPCSSAVRRRLTAQIVDQREVGPDRFWLTLESEDWPEGCRAGQFVHVALGDGVHPVLRRPFSVAGLPGAGRFQLLYKRVGEGTAMLAQKKRGDELDVLGPLGRAFEIANGQRAVLLAGGLGLAPLLLLARELATANVETDMIYGVREKKELVLLNEISMSGASLTLVTEDGSVGEKGYVTEVWRKSLDRGAAHYACGPDAFLRAVVAFAHREKLSAQISLEQKMGCGVGVCMACSVDLGGRYARACTEGPVFRVEEFARDPKEESFP